MANIRKQPVLRMSDIYAPTLKEDPSDADIESAKLLVRAGMIRKEAAGLYTFLPLGMRVISKIETIVREEMDSHGGQEILMPFVQPAELWHRSGRWDVYGPELLRVTDRHDNEFCLGKQTIDGKDYLLMKPVHADFAVLGGAKVDKAGNIWYKGTTSNFNIVMATAADVVIVEAEEIVDHITPEDVRTSGVFVDYVVEGGNY